MKSLEKASGCIPVYTYTSLSSIINTLPISINANKYSFGKLLKICGFFYCQLIKLLNNIDNSLVIEHREFLVSFDRA